MTDKMLMLTVEERVHELKCWPEYYEEIAAGKKTFEIRKDDRGFRVGDTLLLKEYEPQSQTYTGRSCKRSVTYITNFGQPAGCVVMALAHRRAVGWEKPTAWYLIESSFNGPQAMWWSGGGSFTPDANGAVRFARKEDADRVAKSMHMVTVTEHVWMGAAPPSVLPSHAQGVAEGLEMAAKVVDAYQERYEALLTKGKGEWPKPGYVSDQIWHTWQGKEMAARAIAATIGSLIAGKQA